MARIHKFEIGPSRGSLHPSKVLARIKTFGDGVNGPIVQIDTFGSADRKNPGKQSQTIQLDSVTGRQLLTILQTAYGEK